MLLCRFDGDRLGLVDGDDLLDVTAAVAAFPEQRWPLRPGDPLALHLDAVRAVMDEVARNATRRPLTDVRLDSPIASPSKIMAAPANYRLHVTQDAQDPGVHQGVHHTALEGIDRPAEHFGLFLKASSSLSGPSGGIRLNWPDRRNDFEVELAVVIGTAGRRIPVEEALAHVAGYTVGLDITVRGTEDRSFRKSADTYTVLGPWLATADEVPDPQDVALWLTQNGVERQRSSTAAMTVPVAELISLASHAYTLLPGDVLLTGTPEGVGSLEAGDVLVAGASGIGEMTVAVRAPDSEAVESGRAEVARDSHR